jgi:hypothetical protein
MHFTCYTFILSLFFTLGGVQSTSSGNFLSQFFLFFFSWLLLSWKNNKKWNRISEIIHLMPNLHLAICQFHTSLHPFCFLSVNRQTACSKLNNVFSILFFFLSHWCQKKKNGREMRKNFILNFSEISGK